LNATLPEAEAQVAVLGQQVLEEVTPGPDEPQASAIDGRMYRTLPASVFDFREIFSFC